MIHSMTAFARSEQKETWGSITWEIRSVNSRYLEPHFKLPELFKSLEIKLREQLRKQLDRGKVEVAIRYQINASEQSEFNVDESLIQAVLKAAQQVQSISGDSRSLSTSELLRWPGVLEENRIEQTLLDAAAMTAFQTALKQLKDNRLQEGTALKALIEQRLDSIATIAKELRLHLPEVLAQQRQKLQNRLEELKTDLDPQRIEQEIVLLAQKMDVDEELDRLETHVNEVRRILNKGGACGRRLDFLMQELNREANTLSSKSINSGSTQSAVELKVLIEQMREQIQNIE